MCWEFCLICAVQLSVVADRTKHFLLPVLDKCIAIYWDVKFGIVLVLLPLQLHASQLRPDIYIACHLSYITVTPVYVAVSFR